jgi:hypothetical protein
MRSGTTKANRNSDTSRPEDANNPIHPTRRLAVRRHSRSHASHDNVRIHALLLLRRRERVRARQEPRRQGARRPRAVVVVPRPPGLSCVRANVGVEFKGVRWS